MRTDWTHKFSKKDLILGGAGLVIALMGVYLFWLMALVTIEPQPAIMGP